MKIMKSESNMETAKLWYEKKQLSGTLIIIVSIQTYIWKMSEENMKRKFYLLRQFIYQFLV